MRFVASLVYDKCMTDLPITPQSIKDTEVQVVHELTKRRDNAYQKHPLPFVMLGAFGIVATFYGFEGMIDRISWLSNNPIILLAVGISALVVTGQLYKKLG